MKLFVETKDARIIEIRTTGTAKLPVRSDYSTANINQWNKGFKKNHSYFNYELEDEVIWSNIRKMWMEE